MADIRIYSHFFDFSSHKLLDAHFISQSEFSLSDLSRGNYTRLLNESSKKKMVRSVAKATNESLAESVLSQVESHVFMLKTLLIQLMDPEVSLEEKKQAYERLSDRDKTMFKQSLPQDICIEEDPTILLNYWKGDQNLLEAFSESYTIISVSIKLSISIRRLIFVYKQKKDQL